MKQSIIITQLISIVIILSSCRSQSTTPGSTDTATTPIGYGIEGLVLKGPISPVSIPGQPNTAPLAGAKIAITNSSGGFNTTVISDTSGKFFVKLSPDSYMLTPQPFSNSGWPRPQGSVISVVPANSIVYDTLNYDTGIR